VAMVVEAAMLAAVIVVVVGFSRICFWWVFHQQPEFVFDEFFISSLRPWNFSTHAV
jgi:hypothetical protein